MNSPQHITGKDNLIPPQAIQNLKQTTINKSPLKEKMLTAEITSLNIKQGEHENKENIKTVESVEGKSDDKPTKRTTLSGKSLTSSRKVRREERG